jgi:DNA-binding LacI/PurR family transcriptional regulator/PAS domain-containing protein
MSEREKLKKQNKKDNKPTIGLLMGLLNETSWTSIWSGVADMARERDINLICFTGGMLEDTVGFQKQANVLYDLIDVEQLDGLIIWSGIGKFVDAQTLETFYKKYQSVPTVTIGDSIADMPAVLADNYGGMYQAVTHLVEDHGYHRIAYVKGHENFQEHEERYRAYCDALKEYGLAFDQNLVVTENDTGISHLNREVGNRAIEILLDERQAKFEALIVNDDVFAYGAIEALQSRGIHIPNDLPVVGFNDDSESQYITPPLTTVPYPYYELGRQATEMLLTQLAGNNTLDRLFVPTRLGVRQSCSCLDPSIEQISGSTMPTLMKTFSSEAQQSAGRKIVDILAEHREDILSEVEQTIELSLTGYEGELINPAWFEQLLDAFGAELSGTPGIFLRELDDILRQVAVSGDVMVWQNAISGLRRQVVTCLVDEEILLRRAEDLWQQARVMISDFVKRVEGYKTLQVERQAQLINALERDLINTVDIPEMMDVLAHNLPKLGISSCYLSLYQNPKQSLAESRLLLAYDKRGRRKVKETDLVFPSTQLAPNKMFHTKKTYSLVVEPLYFREDQQGFILFESEELPGELYDTLREQISSALQAALQTERRKEVEQELAQERDLLQALMDTSFDLIYFKDLES